MKTSPATAALLGTLAVALVQPVPVRAAPLTTLPAQGPKAVDARDARAATVFKSANGSGESTFIPANSYCTNMSAVPGGWVGAVASLSVERGCKCDFYLEEGCGVDDFSGGGAVLEVGSRAYKDVRRQLGRWTGAVASVYCQRL